MYDPGKRSTALVAPVTMPSRTGWPLPGAIEMITSLQLWFSIETMTNSGRGTGASSSSPPPTRPRRAHAAVASDAARSATR